LTESQRHDLVARVRKKHSMRSVARQFGVRLGTVQRWVKHAEGQRLDRVDWSDKPSGCRQPRHRITTDSEDLILETRRELKDNSALGEFGAAAIRRTLLARRGKRKLKKVPSVRTIGRVLARRGALDGNRRVRRPPPPRGWFLQAVATRRAELEGFDWVEDLMIRGGSPVQVLNGISLHGGLCGSWPRSQMTAKNTVDSLVAHWREFGLPTYAKFDNGTVFQGTHAHPNSFGRVTRLCLSLQVIPVFAPPHETGFQADIENFNGRWQAKVWRRFEFASVAGVLRQSDRFVAACRQRGAARIEAAPHRRPFPADWQLNLQADLNGQVIFLRRTDEQGYVSVLGHRLLAAKNWCHRLVRANVDLTRGSIRIYSLRRREPNSQPLLKTYDYETPHKHFQE